MFAHSSTITFNGLTWHQLRIKKNQGFFLNLGQDNIFCFYTLKRKAFDVSGAPLVSGTEVCAKRQLNSMA